MSIVRSLLAIGSELHRNGDKIVGEYGLNQQQFVVLSEIVDRGPVNQSQLIGGLVIEKSNLSKIAKKLKAQGLIDTSPSPDDGRATLLSVTGAGQAVWKDCMDRLSMWTTDWLRPLSPAEVTGVIQVLERLKALPQ